ncbi:hypothetical protein ACQRUO_32695, partial [Kitasatospora sp. LaBMicrA B282]
MTDGGHVPNEGLPEHLLPETGTEPAPGGGGWGGDLVGQTVPAGVVGPGYTFIDQPDRVDQLDDEDDVLLMPGPQGSWSDAAAPVVPLGEALAPQAPGYPAQPVYAAADGSVAFPQPAAPVQQVAQVVPLVPVGPEAVAQAAAAPVAQQDGTVHPIGTPVATAEQPGALPGDAAGTPVEPSWPPLDPPGAAAPGQVAPVAGVHPAAAQQPTAPARRPLHAVPPIPDPSVMTG